MLALVLLLGSWWINQCLLYLGATVFLTCVVAPFVDDWRPKGRLPAWGKAVLISGCDTGFGYRFAQRLDELGIQVFAGCLFPDNEGAQELKNSCSERLHIVPLDVTSDESVKNAVKYVADNIRSNMLWAVVNNAGVNAGAEIAWTSLETTKRIFEVNTFGVIRLTKAFLPLLCNNKGRVVTVASAYGRYTYPAVVPYCMTKHATVSLCEGLRLETYRFGIKVITIEPWMYKTPIVDKGYILNYMTKAWEVAAAEVKELYPKNYLEQITSALQIVLNLSVSHNLQEVVNCVEEAILALDPKYVYNPGTFYSRFTFWFLSRMPKPIADALIHDTYQLTTGVNHKE